MQLRPPAGTARIGDEIRWRRYRREQPHARFERCHLKTLGESAFQFELSYFAQQPTVNPLLDLQQAVNFRIIDELRHSGVEFAYPTQLVMLQEPQRAVPAK